jgi:hypothetical protein
MVCPINGTTLTIDPDMTESGSSSTTIEPPKPNENVLDASSGIPSPIHNSYQPFPEWDKLCSHRPEIAAIPLHSHDIPNDHLSNLAETGDISPTPSMVVLRAPPTTPATPKREIKLVTAGSSAADWFTHGFVGITLKDLKPFVKETTPVNLELQPTEKVDIPPEPANLMGPSSAVIDSSTASMTGIVLLHDC